MPRVWAVQSDPAGSGRHVLVILIVFLPAPQTLSTHVSNSFPLVQFVVSTGARTLGLKPFVQLTADQLLFGYDDTLVRLAHSVFPKHLRSQAQMGLLLGVSSAAVQGAA